MHAKTKLSHLDAVRRVYFGTPGGLSDVEVAELTGIPKRTVHRYRTEDFAGQVVETSYSKYTMRPSENDLKLAHAILHAIARQKVTA